MKGKRVYIAKGGWDYDGFEIVGVYESRQDAWDVLQECEDNDKFYRYDWIDVVVKEIK